MALYTFLFLLFHLVVAEWVEIIPILNNKTSSETIQTTTSNYDIFLTTPFIKGPVSFTTASTVVISTQERPINSKLDALTTSTVPTVPSSKSGINKKWEVNNGLSYQTFIPFLQMVQQKLLSYKSGPFFSKLSIMKHLRDQLLKNIYERITNLWTQSDETEARGYKDDGSMDFPSNEGALMTIGFLTFAVFLIKLVIKLVEALKYKNQEDSNTTTTAASIVLIHRQRDINEGVAKISRYIDEYQYH